MLLACGRCGIPSAVLPANELGWNQCFGLGLKEIVKRKKKTSREVEESYYESARVLLGK